MDKLNFWNRKKGNPFAIDLTERLENKDVIVRKLSNMGYILIKDYEIKKKIIEALNRGEFPREFDSLTVGWVSYPFGDLPYYYAEWVPFNINELPSILDLKRHRYFEPRIAYYGIGADLSGLDLFYIPKKEY